MPCLYPVEKHYRLSVCGKPDQTRIVVVPCLPNTEAIKLRYYDPRALMTFYDPTGHQIARLLERPLEDLTIGGLADHDDLILVDDANTGKLLAALEEWDDEEGGTA